MWRDLTFTLRSLARRPALTLVAIGTLGLGIGLDFTIIDTLTPMLIRPLPFAEPGRIVGVWCSHEPGGTWQSASADEVLDWRTESHSFSAIAAYSRRDFNLSSEEAPERVTGAWVTPEAWRLLGVGPRLGRDFTSADASPDATAVVHLGDSLWRRRFGADPTIVGRTVLLDDEQVTVVGIMPPAFSFPEFAQVWRVLRLERGAGSRGNHWLGVIGRLDAGVLLEQASAEMDRIAGDHAARYPETNTGWGVALRPYRDQLIPPEVRRALLLFEAGALFVLLIACANATGVMLVRGAERGSELALRSALGAGRWRLVRLVLVESLMLAAGGGLLGGAIGAYGVKLAVAAVPVDIPYYFSFEVDRYVVALWVAVTVVAAAAVAAVPVVQLAWRRLPTLAEIGRGTAGSRVRTRLRKALVVGELAMAAVLLAGAVLMLRSFVNVSRADLGFVEDGVLRARVTLAGARFAAPADRVRFARSLTGAVAGIDGIRLTALSTGTPISEYGWDANTFAVEGRPVEPGREPTAVYCGITADYLATMGIVLREGRPPTDREALEAGGVAVVSESLARELWPRGDALGQRIRLGGGAGWLRIVGVAADVSQPFDLTGTEWRPPWQIYGGYVDDPRRTVNILAATAGDPATFASALRAAAGRVAPGLPLYDVTTMRQVRSRVSWLAAYWGKLASTYAIFALLLAAAGVYGVVAYSVTLRRREIGVRMAIGAAPDEVMAMVLREGGEVLLAGAAIGLAGALVVGRVMARLLYGVAPADPLSLAASFAVLAGVALVACLVPARRAMSIDPAEALRCE